MLHTSCTVVYRGRELGDNISPSAKRPIDPSDIGGSTAWIQSGVKFLFFQQCIKCKGLNEYLLFLVMKTAPLSWVMGGENGWQKGGGWVG